MAEAESWWVKGLLYENCSCQLLCRAHIAFTQECDNEVCIGFWGVHVNKGRFGPVALDEQDAVIMYQTPPRMADGGWTVKLFLDQRVADDQRAAIQKILSGEVGGPWKILAKFFERVLPAETVPIHFDNDGKRITLSIEGVVQSTMDSVENSRSGQKVALENLFNAIHSNTHFLATGSSVSTDGDFQWTIESKHALFSDISWTGP